MSLQAVNEIKCTSEYQDVLLRSALYANQHDFLEILTHSPLPMAEDWIIVYLIICKLCFLKKHTCYISPIKLRKLNNNEQQLC